jgi:amphi-Trp domain-containing protein
MPGSPQEFKHESVQDPQSVVRFLQALSDGFQGGRLLFRAGEAELIVEPQGLIKFAIKAKRDGKRIRITTRMSWKERGDVADSPAGSGAKPLVIGPTKSST